MHQQKGESHLGFFIFVKAREVARTGEEDRDLIYCSVNLIITDVKFYIISLFKYK